jgi:hypothetical protein
MNKAYETISMALVLLLKTELASFFFKYMYNHIHPYMLYIYVCVYVLYPIPWSMVPVSTTWRGLRLQVEKTGLDGDGSFEYIEYRVMEGSQRVIL